MKMINGEDMRSVYRRVFVMVCAMSDVAASKLDLDAAVSYCFEHGVDAMTVDVDVLRKILRDVNYGIPGECVGLYV